jgi:hypothetical protein
VVVGNTYCCDVLQWYVVQVGWQANVVMGKDFAADHVPPLLAMAMTMRVVNLRPYWAYRDDDVDADVDANDDWMSSHCQTSYQHVQAENVPWVTKYVQANYWYYYSHENQWLVTAQWLPNICVYDDDDDDDHDNDRRHPPLTVSGPS